MTNNPLQALLDEQHIVVSDGAMATELEKRGVQIDNELWSATALLKDPGAVQAVHESYFFAGASIATTNTYQANLPSFADFGINHDDGVALIEQAVILAQHAVAGDDSKLIAGSVGPYGAYLADGSEYTGDYSLSKQEYQDFHRLRMQALYDAGVDFFAFETMPNFEETKALVDLLTNEFPTMTAWLSFSIGDRNDKLCDGTELTTATEYFNDNDNVIAVGVNCTNLTNITAAINRIDDVTDKAIVVYPNNGDIYDPDTKTWKTGVDAPIFTDLVPEWINAGAQIIGGCCRTTPDDIAEIQRSVNEFLN